MTAVIGAIALGALCLLGIIILGGALVLLYWRDNERPPNNPLDNF